LLAGLIAQLFRTGRSPFRAAPASHAGFLNLSHPV
jgi:hypothetical protein